jgi:hypothetical protein
MFSFWMPLSLCVSFAAAFVPYPSPSGCRHASQGSRLHDAQSTNDELRSRAEKLRREAEELESKMKREKKPSASTAAVVPKKTYTTLDDSEWTLSYRFASDPLPKDDADGGDQVKLRFYSGKVGIKLRSDGYTDITDEEQVKDITYSKFWGWDEELSNEDGLRYLLFSADVALPADDNNAGADRFYFQARVEQDERTKEISLADGKVTVKRDIEPPGGFWGVFNGGGILAQFRICGDFICRTR